METNGQFPNKAQVLKAEDYQWLQLNKLASR